MTAQPHPRVKFARAISGRNVFLAELALVPISCAYATHRLPSWDRNGLSREAGEGTRTLDLRLGKPTLYQLSYARKAHRVTVLRH